MGGLEGRGCDMAVQAARLTCQLTKQHNVSWGALCLDLVSAFYTTIRQLAISLPGTREELEWALENMPIPPVLLEGVKAQLQTQPLYEQRIDNEHMCALMQESQRGAFWRVANAPSFTVPRVGTRPGSTFATDTFNAVFRRVHDWIEEALNPLKDLLATLPPFPPGPLTFATQEDLDQQEGGGVVRR